MKPSEPSLCAFVLRRSPPEPDVVASSTSVKPQFTLVELGPIAPIEEAVREWREALGAVPERGQAVRPDLASVVTRSGQVLRALVLDPLLGAIGEAERLIVVLDDVLQLVPFDALPMPANGGGAEVFAGERWRIDTRRTCTELLAAPPAPMDGALVALGGAAFNSAPVELSVEDLATVEEAHTAPATVASILRGGAWEPGFAPLTYTGLEAREVAALHDEVAGEQARSLVLEKRKASRAALEELAPHARWLHVATHGWFAPESIRSWSDPEPLDKLSGLGLRQSGEEQVKGMSPMLLCGLALAGANLPENAIGRAPGLITAQEIAALDLTHCELAVLSACDTNVGVRERRAGQGVASLQMALQMAGARSVITSLWKVPDEATKELMLDFYRRLWVEKKPKWQALKEAKRKLRDAKDEHGDPKYTLRDWAAWVLTGEPD
ncbi:MAG: CHAT domain-containing protein [Planctomycetes bacterium]|nr:CHAT domain-containing protein [Planctomycetota bacterium]